MSSSCASALRSAFSSSCRSSAGSDRSDVMVAVDGSEPGESIASADDADADAVIDRYLATAFKPLATTWLRLYPDGLVSGPAGNAIRHAEPALRVAVARRALLRWQARGGPTAFAGVAEDPRDETGIL